MVQGALICAIVYWTLATIDGLLSWQTLARPIVAATVTGLVLGDLHTGLVMGAQLEAVFMGISAIGGVVAADSFTASILSVAFTVLTGSDIETGMTIAMPVGTLMSSFNSMFSPIWASLSPMWEELAAAGDMKKFRFCTIFFNACIQRVIQPIVLFLAVAYGTEALQAILASLPAFVTRGLGAASGMMTGVGYAILLSMLWTGEVGPFFFVGFVLAKYLGMDSLSIAILGAVVAITMFFGEKRYIDLKNAGGAAANSEEDFF